MNPAHLAPILSKLSNRKIGLAEAAVLFAFDGETTYSDITSRLGLPGRTAWSRMAVLKRKGLVETRYWNTGAQYHQLTARGRKVVREVVGAGEIG